MRARAATFATGGPLITADELLARLGDPNLRVIDATFELLEPAAGAARYAAGHIPGAVYLDLDQDLSGPPGGGRGRHPLPDMRSLAGKLAGSGIGGERDVVVYDATGSMYAARAWWLLRYAGHQRVRFLDGGLAAYERAGGELTTAVPRHAPATFELALAPGMVATGQEVHGRLDDPTLVLLDARAPERYRGEIEPLDAKSGHIPGARNLPYTLAMGAGGLLEREALAQTLDTASVAGADVVAYCGSGVSAAHLILALEAAGLPGVRLYPGSWSAWSSDPEMPVATGDDDRGERTASHQPGASAGARD